MLEPNLWMANAPGSTMFMPIADASESVMARMAMALANGNVIVDDAAGCPAGDLEPFIRRSMLNAAKGMPLSVIQQVSYESNCSEAAFMAHNVVLTMQAMGLGGLYLAGLRRWCILGAIAEDGTQGFGFRFQRDERWTQPNPVVLDGHFEGMCPPYHADMRAAVAAFVDCLTVAQCVHDTYGKSPGAFETIVLPGFVEAVHLDTASYDTHYRERAYFDTHAEHIRRWHG